VGDLIETCAREFGRELCERIAVLVAELDEETEEMARCAERGDEGCVRACVERCTERHPEWQRECAVTCKAEAVHALARAVALSALERAVVLLREGTGARLPGAAAIAYAGIVADMRKRLPEHCPTRELVANAAAIAAAVLAEMAGYPELKLLAAVAASLLEGCPEELERLLDAARKFSGYSEEEVARIASALEERALAIGNVVVLL
jgi:hypothetical protein